MRNINTLLLAFCLLSIFGCGQQKKKILISDTYEEPKDLSKDETENWDAITNGMHASFSSKYIRFTKSNIPKIDQNNTWQTSAWRGERISTQMVLWSKDSVTNVSLEIADFVSESGAVLPSDIAKIRFEKYVITDEFGDNPCGKRKAEDFDSSLVADVLEDVSSYAIVSKEIRPVWITIDVPAEAKADTYKSSILVNIEGQERQKFDLEVKVIPKLLPPARDWKFHLDLWQNPYAVAGYHKVAPWSPEHWKLLKPIMKRLANAGQKAITVSLNKRPWGGQTFDQFESMIQWTKKTDGSWEYDFSIFDDWVQFMMDFGIDTQINGYSMVPWGNEFYYFDESENREVKIKAAPGSEKYVKLWTPFLSQFSTHLEEKGWAEITRLAMDERGPEEMQAMIDLLNNNAPEFGIALADNHKSYKLYPDILKDLSVAYGATIDKEDLAYRKENGYVSTFYSYCADEFPNTFTYSPPAEGVFTAWYSTAANFDGFLRWAYNSWVEKPLQDSRFRQWSAGDTYIVYPGNRSSIRFETLREGVQDAEKIRILREDLKNKNQLDELNHLNKVVSQFNITKKPEDLEDMLEDAKKTLNNLAEKQ